ncbi:hypothetical protein ACTQWG_10375 [Blautia sp. HCP3S3_H10_1]|uniref:hypothetical protein n=1 Tax=unclassified Blautia TaxID=2648079 RepID=UPI003F8E8113|nr:hypothetical protein [Clostridia bacterium]
MSEKNNLFSATGIPSLFLIFGVLMLVILSLLGYGTSRQDLRSSTLSLNQTTAYYNACTEATDFYADMVQTLEGFTNQVLDKQEYYKLVSDYFSQNQNAQWDPDKYIVSYVKAFSDTQSLEVQFLILWKDPQAVLSGSSDNAIARILTWNTIVTADWNPDTRQSVFKGE